MFRASSLAKGAEIVYWGIEPIQTYAIDLTHDTWNMNFYMWFRWKPHPHDAAYIDPVTSMAFDNSSNAVSNFSVTYSYTNAAGQEAPTKLSNGDYYQLAYYQVGFAADYDLARFPFDTQKLQIRFENTTDDFSQLVYLPDPQRSFDQHLVVANWATKSVTYSSYVKHYQTDFGNPDLASQYSNWSLGVYTITVARPTSHFWGKLFLPLLIALIASLSVLLIKPEHEISRIALAGTALLTVILIQQGYANSLPDVVPIVLMDKIYVLGYVVVMSVFIRSIWETRQVFHLKREAATFIIPDRWIALALGMLFLTGCALLVY